MKEKKTVKFTSFNDMVAHFHSACDGVLGDTQCMDVLRPLKDQYTEGDEYWAYNDMGILCGSRGYALLRGDFLVAHVESFRA